MGGIVPMMELWALDGLEISDVGRLGLGFAGEVGG